jgi:hypothetical protein
MRPGKPATVRFYLTPTFLDWPSSLLTSEATRLIPEIQVEHCTVGHVLSAQ